MANVGAQDEFEPGEDRKFFPMTDMAQDEKEFDKIIVEEGSELKMWKVHAMNIFLVAFSLLVNLLRGSPKTQSIIGISKCGVVDFTLLLGFIMFNLVVT